MTPEEICESQLQILSGDSLDSVAGKILRNEMPDAQFRKKLQHVAEGSLIIKFEITKKGLLEILDAL